MDLIRAIILSVILFSFPLSIQSTEHDTSPINITFVGDSITQGTTGESYFNRLKLIDEPWGLDRVNMTNSGENGYRLGFFYGNPHIVTEKISSNNPNYVLIYIGINDVEFNLPQNFKLHYEYLIDTIYAQDDDNSIQNIFLIQFSYSFDVDETVAQQYLNVISEIALAYELPILDLWTPTYQNQSLLVDSLHPNAEGADLIAREIDSAFGQLIDLGTDPTNGDNSDNPRDSEEINSYILIGISSIILVMVLVIFKYRDKIRVR